MAGNKNVKFGIVKIKNNNEVKFIGNNNNNSNNGGVFKIKNNGNLDKFFFRLTHTSDNLNKNGIIRFNRENSRFEIAQNNTFVPFSKDSENVLKNATDGKSFFKRLNFSDNYLNKKNITNKGSNRTDIGNIFREIKVKQNSNLNKIFIDYNSNLIFSNPSYIYNLDKLFDLYSHTITYTPNNNNSYKVYVRKNPIKQVKTNDNTTISCFKNDTWENYRNITQIIKSTSYYEYSFEDYFPFYNNKFKKMYINSQGYISFTSGKKLVKNNGLISFDLSKFNQGSITLNSNTPYTDQSLTFIGNINQEGNTIIRNINGVGGSIDYTTDDNGFIKPDTIVINNTGKGYVEGDVLLINSTNASLIVKTIRNDSEDITYSNSLQDYSINFLYGKLKFTYLTKVYIGIGKYREIVITFVNLFYENQVKTINCQIRLWDNNSFTIQNKFKNKFLHYSDDYYELGSIEVSYDVSKINGIYIASSTTPQVSNLSIGMNNLYLGLSNYIDYDSYTFKPLDFGKLIDKKINFKKSMGIPEVECKILFQSSNPIKMNSETGNSDFQTIGYTEYYYYNITDSDWTSSYLSDDGENKFYTNVIDFGKFNIDNENELWSTNIKNFILFTSTEFDKKLKKGSIHTIGNINGKEGVNTIGNINGTENVNPTSGNNILCSGGSGSGCKVNYNINNNPAVTIVNGGSGYNANDTLTVGNTTIEFVVLTILTSANNILCSGGTGSGCIVNYNINNNPEVNIVNGGSGYSTNDTLTLGNTSITFVVLTLKTNIINKISNVQNTTGVNPTSANNVSCSGGDGSGCIVNYNILSNPIITIVDGGAGFNITNEIKVGSTSITFNVESTLDGGVNKYYSSSSVDTKFPINNVLKNENTSYLDSYLADLENEDLTKMAITTKSLFSAVVSLKNIGNTDNENFLKDYVDLYTNQYTDNLYDSYLYKIQFRKYEVSLNKKFSANIDIDSSNTTKENNNSFEKVTNYETEEHLIMKVIYKLKSDDIPFNISFENAFQLPIDTANNKDSVGDFGPYNLVNDNPIYFKATFNKETNYTIKIEDNLYSDKDINDLKLELYNNTQTIIHYIELPYHNTDNPETLHTPNENETIFIKIYGTNYKNFLLKISSQ